jgi:hypothetical protein
MIEKTKLLLSTSHSVEKGVTKKKTIMHKKFKKIGIWEQIDIVMKDDALDLHKKQCYLNKLRSLIVFTGESKAEVNKYLISEVISTMDAYYPDLPSVLNQKIIDSGRKKLVMSCLPISDFVNVLLYTLTLSLSVKESVSKNVLITHLTTYLHELSKSSSDFSQSDENKLADIFHNVIVYDLHLSQIKVKTMNSDMKKMWKCVLFLIDTLIDQGFLVNKKSITYRPTNLENQYVDSRISRTSGKGYSTNLIFLAPDVREKSDCLSYFFFSKWPLLEPKTFDKENENDTHAQLGKGISKIVGNESFYRGLESAGRLKLTFNYPLFLEGIKKIKTERTFHEYNLHDLRTSRVLIDKARSAYEESKGALVMLERVQRFRTISDYFEKSNHSMFRWLSMIAGKTKIKVEKNFVSDFSEFKRLIEKEDINQIKHLDNIMNNLFVYIIENFQLYYNDVINRDSQTTFWVKFLNNYLDSCYELNHEDPMFEIIVGVVGYLGANKMSNFDSILKLYPQKKVNILSLHLERNKKNLSENELLLIEKNDSNHKRYILCLGNYSSNLEINFKVKQMELYQNYSYYLKPYIGGTGRLTYKGFAPHLHSGKLFRFSETEKQIVNCEGLKHLKRAISYTYKNSFSSFEEHEKWVEKNIDKLSKEKYHSVELLTYIDAYQKALRKEDTGTMVRLDQVASVLFYWGLLAGCDYYKRITNLTYNEKIVYQPDFEITEHFLKPCLEEIKNDWKNRIENGKCSDAQKQMFSILENILLPNIGDKKLNKSIIMSHAHGLTYVGIIDSIVKYVKVKHPEVPIEKLKSEGWFTHLSLKVWHKFQKVSPRTTKLRKIIQKTETAIIKLVKESTSKLTKDNDVFYTNVLEHHDFTIYWDYKEKKEVSWGVYKKEIKSTRRQIFTVMSNESHEKENINSFPLLFIHSIDSAVMRMLILTCDLNWGFIPGSVHDCGLTHPNDLGKMLNAWKASIHAVLGSGKLTNKQFLEKIWLLPTLGYLENNLKKKDLNGIKDLWDSEWGEIPDMEKTINSHDVFKSVHNFTYGKTFND